jgi:hypothetical protein
VEEFGDELARLEREPPLPRGQFPLDDELFDTLDAGAAQPARATLRALPGGREGAAPMTAQEATDGD